MAMKYLATKLPGVVIIEPEIHGDERGYFAETWVQRDFDQHVAPVTWVQDNESLSRHGVVRGLHFQREPWAQAKLVRCPVGTVWDVAVDIRPQSATYGQWVGVELSADNHRQLYLPRGMAHGFAVLSDTALLQYKCDQYYHPEAEDGLALDDPRLAIAWPIPLAEAIISPKDWLRSL